MGRELQPHSQLLSKMLQLINSVYRGCWTVERLHMDYICTLVLHIDKSSILLIGKLRPRARKLPKSQTWDWTRTKISKTSVKGSLHYAVQPRWLNWGMDQTVRNCRPGVGAKGPVEPIGGRGGWKRRETDWGSPSYVSPLEGEGRNPHCWTLTCARQLTTLIIPFSPYNNPVRKLHFAERR